MSFSLFSLLNKSFFIQIIRSNHLKLSRQMNGHSSQHREGATHVVWEAASTACFLVCLFLVVERIRHTLTSFISPLRAWPYGATSRLYIPTERRANVNPTHWLPALMASKISFHSVITATEHRGLVHTHVTVLYNHNKSVNILKTSPDI